MDQVQTSSSASTKESLPDAVSLSRSGKKERKLYKLWSHPPHFSNEELVINPDYFPNCRVGDILEIYNPENPEKKLYLQVGFITSVKGKFNN
jgi:hypothetical protein